MVELVKGRDTFEGNVVAINPMTGISGPLCSDTFDWNAVLCHFCLGG